MDYIARHYNMDLASRWRACVLHHVMGRGIERKRLFIDKRDRQDFDTRLAALAFEKFCTFCTSVP